MLQLDDYLSVKIFGGVFSISAYGGVNRVAEGYERKKGGDGMFQFPRLLPMKRGLKKGLYLLSKHFFKFCHKKCLRQRAENGDGEY